MHKICLLFTLLLTSSISAQSLEVSPQILDFGIKNELNSDSLAVQISNQGTSEAHLRLSIPFRVYGSMPYSVRDSVLDLLPGETKTTWVRCRIRHNTLNPAALLIQSPFQESSGDFCVELRCQGKYSRLYYQASYNLDEEPLKQALKTITGNNYSGFSYDVARDKMYGSIDNINDSVTCIYTGRKARFNTRAGAASNNFNCEHTFPQSLFSQNLPMRSDLHHLFSTDDAANNSRGNLPFGVAVPPLLAVSTNAPSKNGGGLYEPRDQQKGATARAMLYFVIRYEDYSGFFAPQQSILRLWHNQFPPSSDEINRNQAIFLDQANRNPFVDYPQLSDRISNFAGNSVRLPTRKLMVSDTALFTAETGSSTAQSLQIVLWNEGNQAVQVSNIRFLRNHFLLSGSSSISLQANSAAALKFNWNADSNLVNAGNDSLEFTSNDPSKTIVRLPWKRQIPTESKISDKKLFRIIADVFQHTFRIEGCQSGPISVELTDLQGRRIPVNEISSGLYRIPSCPAGLYFVRATMPSQSRSIPFHLTVNHE